MSESIVLQLEQARARATRETVESWQAEQIAAMQAREREELVALFLELPPRMEHVYNREFEDAVRGENSTSALLRERAELDSLFRNIREAIYSAGRGIEKFTAQTGHPVEGVERLSHACATMDRLLIRLHDEWPVGTSAETAEAMAAVARGEALDIDEAFAAIAGVDKDSWLERVAEYKRRGQRSGGV